MYSKVPMLNSNYGQIPISGFRTLQHPKTGRTIAIATTRSNSPFTPAPIIYPVQTVPVQRAGYVTVPRKNRAPSWTPTLSENSSMSPPTSPLSPELFEPVYDNLGLRTTAAGSSTLNLNKLSVFNNNQSNSISNLSAGANLKKYSMKDRKLPAIPNENNKGAGQQQQQQPQHENNGQSVEPEPLYSSANPSTGRSKVPPKVPPKPQKKPLVANGELVATANDSLNGSLKLDSSDNKVINKIYEDCDGTEV